MTARAEFDRLPAGMRGERVTKVAQLDGVLLPPGTRVFAKSCADVACGCGAYGTVVQIPGYDPYGPCQFVLFDGVAQPQLLLVALMMPVAAAAGRAVSAFSPWGGLA